MAVPPELRSDAAKLAAGRLLLGLAAFLFPSRVAQLFGFPVDDYDNGTARALGRLYAVREAALGYHLIAEARGARGPQPLTVGVNLTIDAVDAAMLTTALVRRDGIDRAAGSVAVFAAVISGLWLRLYRRVAAAQRA